MKAKQEPTVSKEDLVKHNPDMYAIRAGFNKLESAPMEIQRTILTLNAQGLATTYISRIIREDFDYKVDAQTVRKYLNKNKDRKDLFYDDSSTYVKLKDDYVQIMSSMLDTHKKLKLSLDKAIEEGEWKSVASITKIMNDNVVVASDIVQKLPDTWKNTTSVDKEKVTIGNMLEVMTAQ